MKKIIRKVGNSVGTIFNQEEQKVWDLEVDDIIEFTIIKHEKAEKK